MTELPGVERNYPYTDAWSRYFGDYWYWVRSGTANLDLSSTIISKSFVTPC